MMSFWWGSDLGDVLFSGVSVHTTAGMVCACSIFAIVSICYEALKVLEVKMHRKKDMYYRRRSLGPCSDDRSNLIDNSSIMEQSLDEPSLRDRFMNSYKTKSGRVLVFAGNSMIKYILMLIVMLYNGYLFFSIIIGTTLGYYIFGYIATCYNMKCIQERRRVGIVCVPECSNNITENRESPEHEAGESSEPTTFTCEVQINSPCRRQSANRDDDPLLNKSDKKPSCCSPKDNSGNSETVVPDCCRCSPNGTIPECCIKKDAENDSTD